MKWWQISAILCSYGFFKEYRPSEPFISPFLTQFKNFTLQQVNEEIYPVGTYCYLCLLIAIFLLTDLLKYKPVLIAGGVSAVITWCLLIFGTTILEMQIVEFFYGFFMASEVAYYTYIYATVDKEHYQKVTSHTRATFLLGKASAGISSQILVHFKINYLQLNYFTVFGVAATVPLAFFLPSVKQSLYFHRQKIGNTFKEDADSSKIKLNEKNPGEENHSIKKIFQNAFVQLFIDFKKSFKNFYVVKWSLWWALATCGYLQAVAYSQLLWQSMIKDDSSELYHGYVEFASSILGAAVAFAIGYLKVSWSLWGEISLSILTMLQGGFLFYSAFLENLYVAYVVHTAYKLCYDAAITVATYEIARHIHEETYALVFGINTFVALCVQATLTAIVIDGLKTDINTQFQIYGCYHLVIAIGFFLCGIYTLVTRKRRNFVIDGAD